MTKVPDDHVGVVLTITEDGQAVFSGPGDELPEGASLEGAESKGSPKDQVDAIVAQQGDVDPEAANDEVVAVAEAKRDADLERLAAQQEEAAAAEDSGSSTRTAKKTTAKRS